MDKNSRLFQGFDDQGDEDTEDLLTLSLSIGPKSSSSSSSSLTPASASASASSPLGQQILQPTCLPLTPAAPLSPQASFFQQILPIPQAPPLPFYPKPTGLNLNDNAVSREIVSHSRPTRSRRNPFQTPRQGKTETIPPPFPWATSQRAKVHTLDYLLSHNITKISGEVQCKKCEKVYKIEYDLEQKFREIAAYISKERFSMNDRAPNPWMNPNLPSCESCCSSIKPVLTKKRSINWLFLLLGEMLGCCKLSELKYFCKHTNNHRTGAKDRVLYLTYLGLCKQLDPKGPFDI